jgi:glycosyltransferase involved in cell wall biosynthesis
VALVFFYPQFKKLTGAERLILKLADYTARALAESGEVVLLTHRFAAECRPALSAQVRLVETGWPLRLTGNHYPDAAVEYAAGPALTLKMPKERLSGVVFFGPPSVPAMWFARRILFGLRRHRVPTLYFCFEPPRFIYSDTSEILARLGRGAAILPLLLAVYRALDRRMVRAADRVLSNSPYGSRRIWKAYRRKATVIEHGVDFAPPAPELVRELRGRYDLEGRKVAVTVNHLHPRKRIDLFLRAISVARDAVPSTTALVVGDGPERAALEALASELGLQSGKDVIFTGAVPEEILPAHYALADVYVHTGSQESFGLSVIEALSLGSPVVAVDEGGPRNTVQHEVSGYLVPPTAEAIGAAVASLFAEPERARQMGKEGARFVATHFNWSNGARTLLRVFEEVERGLKARASGTDLRC